MGYVHIEVEPVNSPKRTGQPCGDVTLCQRTSAATTVVCSDGLGSGIKANIAATMCSARLMELLRQGFSLRQAFDSVTDTMRRARGTDQPYAVFTVLRILSDGAATVLTYEMPPSLLVGVRQAAVLQQRTLKLGNELVAEANCYLEGGEGILLVSDGITQAGLGRGLKNGWQADGVCTFVNDCLARGLPPGRMAHLVHQRAREIWGETAGDDCTALLALCRPGRSVSVLTGPPLNPASDRRVVDRFLAAEGSRIICGASTARMAAERLGRQISVEQRPAGMVSPPRYYLEGIDLVTEGAVTLNQVYNIIEEELDSEPDEGGSAALCRLLKSADRISFLVGRAANPGHGQMDFRLRGILPRDKIVALIADKLRQFGKLVTVEYF